MRRVAVVDLIYGLTLLSFLVLVVSSHASWALEDKRNERGETWGLVANLFHRNPNAAVIETAATSPQLRHDADATISIQNHDRQRSRSTPTSDVNQSSCSQRSHAHHSKKQKFGWFPVIAYLINEIDFHLWVVRIHLSPSGVGYHKNRFNA